MMTLSIMLNGLMQKGYGMATKKISKLLVGITAVAVFSGQMLCMAQDGSRSIYYTLTGIEKDHTVMTIDGNGISSEIYFYWLANCASQVESQIGIYSAYYEEYQKYLEEDGSINWEAEFESGETINQYVREQAEATMKLHAVIENEATEYGIILSENQKEEIDKSYQTSKESITQTGTDFDILSISEESYTRIESVQYYFGELCNMALVEESSFYLAPEEYEKYYEVDGEIQEVETEVAGETEGISESEKIFDFESVDWTDEESLSEEALTVRDRIVQSYMSEQLTELAKEAVVEYDKAIDEIVPGLFYEEFYNAYLSAMVEMQQ